MEPVPGALLTDLYQLTMIQAYLESGQTDTAVFEFFVRKLPPQRGFLMAAGLDQALAFLENLRFSTDELDWLAKTGRFSARLIDYLASFRFSGQVHAMPEGTLFFGSEPILRVTAPMPEAQLVETRLINILHSQTLIASKAARMVLLAPDKLLVDFGLRRRRSDGRPRQLYCRLHRDSDPSCRKSVRYSDLWHDGAFVRPVFRRRNGSL